MLELRADIGGGHHPVSRTTQCGSVDDVRNFEHLVQQGDVAIREVHRSPGCRGEVVRSTNRSGDDEVVDDFAVDFRNHLVGHQVRQGALGVDVVHRLEILSGFQRPRCLELTSNSRNAVTVDAQGHFRLEGVGFEVVLVVHTSDGVGWQRNAATHRDLDRTCRVIERRGPRGRGVNTDGAHRTTAIADHDDISSTVGVEAHAEARHGIVAIGRSRCGVVVHFDHDRSSEDRAMGESLRDDHSTGLNGRVFAVHFLRRVVRVQRPSVLLRIGLRSVLTHDLGTSDCLALRHGVLVADVEDQTGRLAHGLHADEVVSDQLGEALAEQGQREPGKVGDVAGGRLVFQDQRTTGRVHVLVLVLENGGHQAHLGGPDLAALVEDRSPTLNHRVLGGLVQD